MTGTSKTSKQGHDGQRQDFVAGKITPESIEKMRKLIGYPNPTLRSGRPARWHRTATPDSIAIYAESYGDDNPLFTDPAHGPTTRWRSQIAPPGYTPTAKTRSRTVSEALRKETRGALRGVHLFYSGNENTYYRPIFPGDSCEGLAALTDIEEKTSRFGGGTSVITHNDHVSFNRRGEMVNWGKTWFVHTEREASASSGKLASYSPPHYTDEQIAEIDEAYEHEYVRGADTLFWEDVQIDDVVPGVVKGPLTVTDTISSHLGIGWGNYGIGALKLNYQNRKNMPAFYGKNELGVWDVMQRLHWDPAFAQSIGVPTSYDYGFMRHHWMIHALTNWIGDDGWLFRLRVEFRGFNYVGDTTWISGTVTSKRLDAELGPVVEVELSGVNQRGETTVPATATVMLPSRDHGPVELPRPPALPESLQGI